MDQEKVLQDVLEIVQFLRDNAVSKEEAANFATKDDLRNFATKDDLRNFATKDDLKNFVTKDDLFLFEGRMEEKFVTKDYLDERLMEFKSEVINHVDGFAALHQKLDIELAALRHKYNRLEGYIFQLAKHLQVELG